MPYCPNESALLIAENKWQQIVFTTRTTRRSDIETGRGGCGQEHTNTIQQQKKEICLFLHSYRNRTPLGSLINDQTYDFGLVVFLFFFRVLYPES